MFTEYIKKGWYKKNAANEESVVKQNSYIVVWVVIHMLLNIIKYYH